MGFCRRRHTSVRYLWSGQLVSVPADQFGSYTVYISPKNDAPTLAAIADQTLAAEHAGRNAELRERLASLSARERQVLDGLVAGQANKVIAYDLEISPRTVEVYRANVMTKMQARSLSELVRMTILLQRP